MTDPPITNSVDPNRIDPILFASKLKLIYCSSEKITGSVAQSVSCLATDGCQTAYPGVMSSIPARSNTFLEIDHEIIFMVILLPSPESFKNGCCQLLYQKNVHEVLVNCLFKLAQEKVWLGELTQPPRPWLMF